MEFKLNSTLETIVNDVAEVASYLWQREWAERNGGNISVNVTEHVCDCNTQATGLAQYNLPMALPLLANNYFFVTGTGCRMRNVGKKPYENAAFIRISSDGKSYQVMGPNSVKPTSELPSHLAIHQSFKIKGNTNKVVVHTHPIELIAMTHVPRFNQDWYEFSKAVWGMLPETFILVPKGVGLVPYDVPGTATLADLTLKGLEEHDFVMWDKHGILGVGEEVIEVFDLIDTLAKSSKVYFAAKQAGWEPTGLSIEEMAACIEPFGIKEHKLYGK